MQAFIQLQPPASRLQASRPTQTGQAASLHAAPAGEEEPLQQEFNSLVRAGVPQTEIADRLRLTRTEQRELTLQLIASEFICPLHMDAIARASQHHKFLVSFRAAGPATLERLQAGAAAKGHDILEKTIKPSKLAEYYGDNHMAVFAQLKEAGLSGYVGHWNEHGLAGIYITDPFSPSGHRIEPLDLNNLANSVQQLEHQLPDWRQRGFTGDYDMHDMISFHAGGGGPFTPLVGSPGERQIMNAINLAVAKVDPQRPFDEITHNVVRHGPQVNFVSYMKDRERRASSQGVEGSVARPGSFPLAVIVKGEWSIVSSLDELQQMYRSQGAHMKESWKPDGLVTYAKNPFAEGDKVVIHRRSSGISPGSSRRNSMVFDEPASPGAMSPGVMTPDIASPRSASPVRRETLSPEDARPRRTSSNLLSPEDAFIRPDGLRRTKSTG